MNSVSSSSFKPILKGNGKASQGKESPSMGKGVRFNDNKNEVFVFDNKDQIVHRRSKIWSSAIDHAEYQIDADQELNRWLERVITVFDHPDFKTTVNAQALYTNRINILIKEFNECDPDQKDPKMQEDIKFFGYLKTLGTRLDAHAFLNNWHKFLEHMKSLSFMTHGTGWAVYQNLIQQKNMTIQNMQSWGGEWVAHAAVINKQFNDHWRALISPVTTALYQSKRTLPSFQPPSTFNIHAQNQGERIRCDSCCAIVNHLFSKIQGMLGKDLEISDLSHRIQEGRVKGNLGIVELNDLQNQLDERKAILVPDLYTEILSQETNVSKNTVQQLSQLNPLAYQQVLETKGAQAPELRRLVIEALYPPLPKEEGITKADLIPIQTQTSSSSSASSLLSPINNQAGTDTSPNSTTTTAFSPLKDGK